jgi:hypothetical protein
MAAAAISSKFDQTPRQIHRISDAPPPAIPEQPEYTSLVTDRFYNVTDAEEDAFAEQVPAPMPNRLKLARAERLHEEDPSELLSGNKDGKFRRQHQPVQRGVTQEYIAMRSRPLLMRRPTEQAAEQVAPGETVEVDAAAQNETDGGGVRVADVAPPALTSFQIVAIVCSAILVSTVGGAVVYKRVQK